jgi:hypothetical protein
VDLVLAPDIFANASVAPGTDPDRVIQKTIGAGQKVKATPWILERVRAILYNVPSFKREALDQHMTLIGSLIEAVNDPTEHGPDAWLPALVAAAKIAQATRVITDHPDLIGKTESGVDFISSENFLVELALPPPLPPNL